MRTFEGGGLRDTSNGKISYRGFRHPLVEHSFGKYMLRHQKCADGTMRESDNWWAGWSKKVSLESMTRHIVDLEALHAGLRVYKVRLDDEEETVVMPYTYEETFKKKLPDNWTEIDEEEAANAVKFNCNSYLLKHLIK